jgi:predicted nucleotidyltransferase component of viral defense system
VEFFHLSFLEVLQVRVSRNNYVLKGGTNLRYFFKSPRYSEDIDFDTEGVSRWKLESKIDEVLGSRPLATLLRIKGMAIERASKPKQTETTQRWKVILNASNLTEKVPTKIEFSRRGADARNRLDQVPQDIVQPFALRPPTVRRYLAEAMIEQKIAALVDRAETQARDVFDLDLLFRQTPSPLGLGVIPPQRLQTAIDRVLEFTFEAYHSLVVRFLNPDVIELYESPDAWEQIQRAVIDRLRALQ